VTAVAGWARATLPQAKAIERNRRPRAKICECTMVVESCEREHWLCDVLSEKSGVSGVFGEGWAGEPDSLA
jgi:hypothetical protein